MASLSQVLTDNPIVQAELNHQQRSTPTHKWRRWRTLYELGLAVALLSSVALLIAPQVVPLTGIPAGDLNDLLRGWFGMVVILLGGLIMIHHLAFAVAGLQLASTSIAREKQGRTWESLLLTGVDARRIVYGKWWATMRTLLAVYLPMLLMRLAVALWVGISGPTLDATPYFSPPPAFAVILISLVTAIFPICYAAFTMTLGLLASLLVTSETTANRLASTFHFGTVVLSLTMILASFALPFTNIEPGLVSLIPALFVTPLDGGMLAMIGMVAGNGSASLFYLLGLILCMVLYAALTWLLLRGAQALAVRQRALSPASS